MTMTTTTARILSVKDVQEYLGIGKNKAYDLLSTPGCPTIKIHGRYCVFEDSFIKWLRLYEGKSICKA